MSRPGSRRRDGTATDAGRGDAGGDSGAEGQDGAPLILPLPPSINSYHRSVTQRSGVSKVLVSKDGRRWKKEATVAALAQWRRPPLEGPVRLIVAVYFRNRRRDLGNVEKPLSDLLNGVCYADDRQTAEIHLFKRFDAARPRVEVWVEPADAMDAAA